MSRIAAVLVLALAAGCARSPGPGPRGDVDAQGSQPSSTSIAAPGTEGSSPGAARSGASSTRPAATRGPSTGFPTPGPAANNTMPLTATINRTCARVGDEMSSTATTEKNAQLGFSAGYADNTLVPDFFFVTKESNPTGTATWTWVIRPMRSGPANLSVVASKDGKGAAYNIPFRVAERC